MLGSTTVRSTLSAGVGGSGSNVVAYALDDKQDQTIGGYFATAGTGFLTGAGGSWVVGKAGAAWAAPEAPLRALVL
ncbi:hypothetical protein J3D46_002420 [Paenarthrobacter sp. A20]|nr:hypothetical protein [Paenarthrobacter sp. A20]